jgi:uncharacterized protein YjlB
MSQTISVGSGNVLCIPAGMRHYLYLFMNDATQTTTTTRPQTARIDYTTENRRGGTTRKSKEVPLSKLAITLAKLEDSNAYSILVSYESR